MFVLGNLGWRVTIEVLVVVFAIHDSLKAIERCLEKTTEADSEP